MSLEINGFIVVRLPHFNFLVQERDTVPCLNDVYYAGVDRQRWADVFDEDYYGKKAPTEILQMASVIKVGSNDFTGIEICQDSAIALKLLGYSNRKLIRNELIVVRSAALDALKGTIKTEAKVEWLGFDYIAFGEWSLISGGMFVAPRHFSSWFNRINHFGLFESSLMLTEYTLAYKQAVEAGLVEPLAPQSAGFESLAIEIGRMPK